MFSSILSLSYHTDAPYVTLRTDSKLIVIHAQIECEIDIRTLTSHQVLGQISDTFPTHFRHISDTFPTHFRHIFDTFPTQPDF